MALRSSDTCATLSWQPLSVHYESMLVHPGQHGTRASVSLHASAPSLSAGLLEWHSAGLGLTGTWRASSAPAVRTLFSSPEGEVVWACHIPHAHAHVHFDNGMEYTGLGYAEHLLLTIAPWRLPIATLRWGRFLSERESLVWIDWQGPSAQTIVYRNSEPVHAAGIADDRVELSGGARLTLDRSQVLPHGPARRHRAARRSWNSQCRAGTDARCRGVQVAQPRGHENARRPGRTRLGDP